MLENQVQSLPATFFHCRVFFFLETYCSVVFVYRLMVKSSNSVCQCGNDTDVQHHISSVVFLLLR